MISEMQIMKRRANNEEMAKTEFMQNANPTNIGGTVFNNPNDNTISKGLIAYNWITHPLATLIDYYLVYRGER